MKNRKITIFIVTLICAAFLFEIAVRNWSFVQNYWYDGAIEKLKQNTHLKGLFIGTSRVAAAIDPDLFSSYMHERGYKFKVLNLGQGNTILLEHYFGIKKIIENFPVKAKNLTIFIEAPNGIPRLRGMSDIWYDYPVSLPLVTVMPWKQWPNFLQSSMTFEQKLHGLGMSFFSPIKFLAFKSRIRSGVLKKLKEFFDMLIANLSTKVSKQTDVNLRVAGDIRVDKEGIEIVRKTVRSKRQREKTFLVEKWSETVIVKMMSEFLPLGVKIVFYNMPTSSYEAHHFNAPLRQKNKVQFEKIRKDFNIPLIEFPFEVSDQDFPDLMHLSKSRSIVFTKLLAQKFSAMLSLTK